MIVSFLLSAVPPTALTVGGIVAAVALLLLVVKLSAQRPHRRELVGLALGLAMVAVMFGWNEVLAGGLAFLRIEEDLLLTASEGGDFLTDLRAAGLVVMITFVAVAIVTGLLAVVGSLLVGVAKSNPDRPMDTARAQTPQPQAQNLPADGPHPVLYADPLVHPPTNR